LVLLKRLSTGPDFTTNVYVRTGQTFLGNRFNNGIGKAEILDYLSRVKRSAVYRRRRLGALLVASAFAYALYTAAGADAGTEPVTYTVATGDTLWEIATEQYPPSEDPRATIEVIRRENTLEGYLIQPGMRLQLPR
jgi:LysM repeat protein